MLCVAGFYGSKNTQMNTRSQHFTLEHCTFVMINIGHLIFQCFECCSWLLCKGMLGEVFLDHSLALFPLAVVSRGKAAVNGNGKKEIVIS